MTERETWKPTGRAVQYVAKGEGPQSDSYSSDNPVWKRLRTRRRSFSPVFRVMNKNTIHSTVFLAKNKCTV